MPTATSGASRRGEEPPDQRQTGLCSMQRPVILSPGLPPDLPDGFIRRAYRPSDRSSLPTALPEALAGRVTWVILTGWFYTPDLPNASSTARPPDLPDGFIRQPHRAATPACLTDSLTDSLTGSLTGQPHQPAQPTSTTDQPDRQPHRPASPTNPTGHPHPPSSPAKVPPACLTGRLRSAGRRLRGWRSSRHG